jgi:hypothetical protein
MPYREQWKRTEAVRRFRRRQREQQQRPREQVNARALLPIGTPSHSSAPVQVRTPTNWWAWGIAFAVLAAISGRTSAPRAYEGPPWPWG